MVCFQLPPSGNAVPVSFLMESGHGNFLQALSDHNGFPHDRILAASSGAAALYVALRGLSALRPGRRAVAVPAWCCPSVPQTVIQAGLEPILIDLDPATFAYDPEALERARSRDLLAVVLVHFFGLDAPRPPGDWSGTAFIRDCAQDFDHRMDPEDDAPCFYSFGRGKALNAGHGGALCMPARGPWMEACRRVMSKLPGGHGRVLPKAMAINVLSRPRLFWALNQIPFLGIGSTVWRRPLVFARLSGEFPAPGAACLEAYLERRRFYRMLVAGYQSLIGACDRSRIFAPAAHASHAGLPTRFPVVVEDAGLRERIFSGMNARFGGVTRMYPAILPLIPGAPAELAGTDGSAGSAGSEKGNRFPGANRIAGTILTLPVTAELIGREDRFMDCLAGILGRNGALRARPSFSPEASGSDPGWSASLPSSLPFAR